MRKKYFNSETFCAMPFVGLSVNSNGNMKYCCMAEDNLDDNGAPLTINDTQLSEAWNSTKMVEVRKKMINNEPVEGCARCVSEEKFTSYAPRISMTSEWFQRIGGADLFKLINQSKKNGYTLTESPVYLDLRLGNLCNLKCRMCNPWNSSQIDKENKELWNKDKNYRDIFTEEYGGQAQDLEENQSWFESDFLWSDIVSFIPSLKKVYFTGGEPTMIKNNFKFLQECLDQGRKDIIPFFNTNCTNTNKKFTKLISQFDRVEINGSLDGYGEMNDYIRAPSHWKQVKKNFETYASLPNIHLGISPVVQVYNIFNLPILLEYIEGLKKTYDKNIHVDFLLNTHPSLLKAEILPYKIREKAQDRLYKYFKTLDLENLNHITRNSTEKVLNYLTENKDDDKYKVKQFINYTNSLDKHRKQSFEKACPELYTMLKNSKTNYFDNE
tara:strand:+ start:4509 stop:5828 length:1320 start_codon:yes stop_codon:yes gene_type:complete